jgi:hypothetical protein
MLPITARKKMTDRDEVLKAYPDATTFAGFVYDHDVAGIKVGQTCVLVGKDWADARSRLPNVPAPQPTVFPHPMAPRTVVPESADKTPRPYHGPVPNGNFHQAVLDSRAAEHAVSQRIPVNERFMFYSDDAGDYIFESTQPHEHIAAHGATVEEAYRELIGMLELRKQMPAPLSQEDRDAQLDSAGKAQHGPRHTVPLTDPDDFPEPHMEPVEQGEPVDPCPRCLDVRKQVGMGRSESKK